MGRGKSFGAANVINGVARPCDDVNAWVSDPDEPLPQWLEVLLPEPTTFDVVSLVFDTGLHRINYVTPGLFRAPECARDYTVEADDVLAFALSASTYWTSNYNVYVEIDGVPVWDFAADGNGLN